MYASVLETRVALSGPTIHPNVVSKGPQREFTDQSFNKWDYLTVSGFIFSDCNMCPYSEVCPLLLERHTELNRNPF